MRLLGATALRLCSAATLAAACSSPAGDRPAGPDAPSLTRVRACSGPATSLPPAEAARLPGPDTRRIVTDNDRLAAATRDAPGGYAGHLLDATTRGPVLLLTDPARAAAAKTVLAPLLPGFDVAGAEVRPARWTFAQLYDWDRYLLPAAFEDPGVVSAGIDGRENRLGYGVADAAARDRLLARLAQLDLPCDLALVRVTGVPEPLIGR